MGHGVERTNVEIESGFGPIDNTTLFSPDIQNGSGVLFIHGHEGSPEGYSDYANKVATEHGITALTFQLGGRDQPDDERLAWSISDHLLEVSSALDYLASRDEIAKGRIGIFGAGYGGHLAIMLANINQEIVDRVLLKTPSIFPEDGTIDIPRSQWNRRRIEFYRENLKPFDRKRIAANTALRAARDFKGKVYILQSERDEVIPQSVIDAYYLAANGPERDNVKVKTLGGAKHKLTPTEKEILSMYMLRWVETL